MKSSCLSWNNPLDRDTIKRALAQNQVIVGTSDTIPGLLAPLTQEGKLALDRIKGREQKPYIVLISDITKLPLFTDQPFSPSIQAMLQCCWPGPLTVIVKALKTLPAWLSATGTIAIRVPAHEGLQNILSDFQGLFSTSANVAGQPPSLNLEEIDPKIRDACALCIGNTTTTTQPSTIIDITQTPARIIRTGAYDPALLKERFKINLNF
jgi:L-threonylcarbamoyladenylate synthase